MNLEDLIKENRAEFDLHEPPQGHVNRFEKKLHKKTASPRWAWMSAVASVAAIVLMLNVFDFNTIKQDTPVTDEIEQSTNSPTAVINIQEIESFYEHQLDHSKNEIKQPDIELSNDNLLNEHLAKLDHSYQLLKKELERFPDDERILKRMVENYRLRLKLLERHVNQISKNKNNTQYEHS